MKDSQIRVWVEELEPPGVLRFSWAWKDEAASIPEDNGSLVANALYQLEGVSRIDAGDDGITTYIDVDQISRYEIAEVIRQVLEPASNQAIEPPSIRVWAEDLGPTRLRLTWSMGEVDTDETAIAVRRRVAAFLLVTDGIKAALPGSDGVEVDYDPESLDRASLRDVITSAILFDVPLRKRSDELLKRATTYGNLARKLALDGRISPIPEAAKQAAASQGGARGASGTAVRSVLRFVPGATLISRMNTLLPVLMELSRWSRDADPEIVASHLDSVGLDRATLKRDTITAQELRLYARDAASETAASLGKKASEGAQQALAAGRDILSSVREAAANSKDEPPEDSSTERRSQSS